MIDGIENVRTYSEAQEAAALASMPSQEMSGQDSFLKLLVAQMQNQNPLDPQKNSDFVAQLAQFASLEQLMTVNGSLESLYSATSSMNNATMTQLLGRTVMAYSDNFEYPGTGDQDIWLDLNGDAKQVTITITDENDKVVAREEMGAMDEGEHVWTWDGTDVHGNPVGEGSYSITVTAKGETGESVEIYSMIRGEIDGMSFETGVPVPSVNGTEVQIGDILRLELLTSQTDDEDDSADEDAV